MDAPPSLPAARRRLATVLRASKETVSIETAARALSLERRAASKLLSQWAHQGWLRRIGRGIYVAVPLALFESEQLVDDPWVLTPSLFGECYIGGWTAAHHWDLTEQLFKDICVFTARRVDKKRASVQGVTFVLQHADKKRMFGLKSLWRGSTRVNVSDPARTVLDMLAMPETGGGIDHVTECIAAYLKSSTADTALLIRYAEQFGNGAVFKRLGYLSDTRLRRPELAAACRARLTKGYAKLDPALVSRHLVTAWRLWVPERWKRAGT